MRVIKQNFSILELKFTAFLNGKVQFDDGRNMILRARKTFYVEGRIALIS